ncbi:uncharacterized protein LOC118423102 [Branchiostoma floridae]|uniref:Uncharacterized protein LOC118423102 n=1 Tax=Branchiostoma floridae TaxID=7739 RepID=A0A9J7LRP6_BRAFL|nr:uncharacterized protein LOC118423102 [Branchiostoma floridae]
MAEKQKLKERYESGDPSLTTPAKPTTDLAVMAACPDTADLFKEYVTLGVEAGMVDLEEKDAVGMTALHWAVIFERLDSVRLLIQKGAVVDQKDMLGFTPLFYCTGRKPNVEVARVLIEEGHADVNARTNTLSTPLHGAALQGNHDCLKLLLKHGADPNIHDEEGTSSLDLCRNDPTTKALLYKHSTHKESAKEKAGACCSWCHIPGSSLKRCARCHVKFYCSKECQAKDWKEGGHKHECKGYVVAVPMEQAVQGISTTASIVRTAQRPTFSIHQYSSEIGEKWNLKHLQNKQFIVKVQVPIGGDAPGEPIMVYNEDKTTHGMILSSQTGYSDIRRKVASEGWWGCKAFFWAELSDKVEGGVNVFHGKCAPWQQW